MAKPIFSNSIIGKAIENNNVPSHSFFNYTNHDVRMIVERLEKEIQISIRNYFFERKCICDKNIRDNICDKCFEDNIIEKDLIGVFRIAE